MLKIFLKQAAVALLILSASVLLLLDIWVIGGIPK